MTEADVLELFDRIKKQYFPHWDKNNLWHIEINKLTISGLCRSPTKTIHIAIHIVNDERLTLVIIHEICHAVTYSSHGEKWQKRFLSAASRADMLGDHKLASKIREEVSVYGDKISNLGIIKSITATSLQSIIRDLVLFDDADVEKESVESVIGHAASQWGLNFEELMILFPRSLNSFKATFEKAMKEKARDGLLRQRVLERLKAVKKGVDE